ncbi:IS5 family transposase [Gluconobacter wancherniae NBRC 103581]|nr:IS5 family transposase [Gluconobacter wancherniae NBRC 103581]
MLGRSRAELTTDIHMLSDALRRPLQFIITAEQVHDPTQASALLEGQTASAVIADQTYDSKGFRERITIMNAKAVIPSKRNRKIVIPHDRTFYKDCNRIEECFNRLKNFRCFAKRYDRKSHPFYRLHSSRSSQDLDHLNVDWS